MEEGDYRVYGVLGKYLEDSGFVADGDVVSAFEHVRPEDRDPQGFFDYVLQAFVDFGSEDMGGSHVLEFKPDRNVFNGRYTKVQRLNCSNLSGSLMDRYGFDLDDLYSGEEYRGAKTELGNSLMLLTDMMEDYDEPEKTYKGREYSKGFTEDQVNQAIEEYVN